MLCRKLIEQLERRYPREDAMDWDNVGLLVGRRDKEVQKVLVTLDVTEEVIEKAVAEKVDLIVSHHPLLFSSVKRITDETVTGRRLLTLLKEDIGCYAAHTNYDILRMGDLAAERLCLTSQVPLEPTSDGKGIGKVGMLPEEMSLASFCEFVKSQFHLPDVKAFGKAEQRISKVAICPGSGKGMMEHAIKHGADVLLTGDMDHHTGLDAVAEGLMVIDAGHYGLEYPFMEDMAATLQEFSLDVEKFKIQFPFQTI